MKRNAFTLIELVAVIVILAVILAITIPSITGVISNATKAAFESDAKLVLKAVDYKKLEDASFNGIDVNQNNIGDLLGLSNTNYSNVKIVSEDNNLIITIIGRGKWEGLVACGTYQNMSVLTSTKECNTDLIPPVITLLGDNPVNIFVGESYIDAGAIAIDDVDGDITSSISKTGTVNSSVPGTYIISYISTDIAGNQTEVVRIINVIDNIGPVITFNPIGNITYTKGVITNIKVSDVGGIDTNSLKYIWSLSATQPSSNLFTSSYIDNQAISTPNGVSGSYYLWATAIDLTGNTTTIRSNVFNLDNESPIITLNGNDNITINKGSTYIDAGATAVDNIDGVISVTTTGIVNPSVVGTYTITYNATDSSDNIAMPVTRMINVVDVSAPVITILGSNPVDMDAGTTYNDAGATAVDDVDGNITSRIITSSTVNPNLGGIYTVTYTVTDNAGNTANSSRTIRVYVTWYSSRTVNPATYYGDYAASSNTTYSCPNGYTTSGSGSGTTCTKTTAASYTTADVSKSCSDGSTYVSSVDKCRIYTDSRNYSCSIGAVSGTRCITSATPYCYNPTYSIVGSVCRRTVSCTKCNGQGLTCMNTLCGAGGYENENWSCGPSTCTATMTILYSCSSGTLSGTDCLLGFADESCPGGWTMSAQNNCYQNTVTPTTTYSCSSGTLNGSYCYSCSSGTLSGTDCISTTSNIPNTTYYCPSGGSLSGTTCYRGYYQCSSGTLSGNSCYGSWSAWSTTPKTPSSTLEVQTEKRLTSY